MEEDIWEWRIPLLTATDGERKEKPAGHAVQKVPWPQQVGLTLMRGTRRPQPMAVQRGDA